VYAIVT